MSLTHPQTPINRSLPKAFKRRREFRNTKALQKSSLETLKNFNPKIEEHSKQNHPNYLPRSQRSLESSSKASKNLNKLQIGEALRIQASKATKNFHHKSSNTKNIRSRIIQTICLDLKVHWNQAQKPPETSNNHKSVKFHGFKPLKPRRTSTTNLRRRRTHEEYEEREEQRISNKLIARDSL